MIRVKQVNENVQVEISGVVGYKWFFTHNVGHQAHALLLEREINKVLCNHISAIRREAYHDGWADAKAKRAKSDWFAGWL